MFKKWEDYTELEQLACEYSDYHKAVIGFRPRFDQSSWTVEDYKKAMDSLSEDAEREAVWQAERETTAVKELEAALALTMATCNCDRGTAWRYLKDAEGDDWHDDGYYEYSNDLPRGYLIKTGLEVKETA